MKIAPSAISRRHFIYASGLTLAASALSAQKIIGANETVRLGFIGMGRRSRDLLAQFIIIPGVEIVAICDPDTAQMDKRLKTIQQLREKALAKGLSIPETRVEAIQDYRKGYEVPKLA